MGKSIDGSWFTTSQVNVASYIEENVTESFDLFQVLYSESAQCPVVNSDTLVFTVDLLPDVFAGNDTSFCFQDSNYVLQGYNPGLNENGVGAFYGLGAAEFAINANGVVDHTLLSPGTYDAVYLYTDTTTCSNSDTVTFTILTELEPPILSPSILGDICYGFDLTVTAFVQHPWLEYQWLLYDELGDTTHIGDGDTTIEFENLIDSFSIALEISSTFDCGTVTSDILELNVLNELTVPVIDDEINGLPLCFGFSPGNINVVTEATGGSNEFSYEWVNMSDPTDTGSELSLAIGELTENTTYYCTATDAQCGSLDSDPLTIEVLPQLQVPVISNANEGLSICYNTSPGDFVEVTPATGADNDFTISWFMEDELDPSLQLGETTTSFTSPSITDTTNYYAVYASTYGCGSVSSNIITVNVLPEYETPILSPSIIGDICYGSDLTVTASDFVQHPWLEYQWLLYDELGDTTHIGDGGTTIEFENLIDSFSIALEISSTFDCETVTSDILELNVLNELTVPVISNANEGLSICYNTSPGDFVEVTPATGADNDFTISWFMEDELDTSLQLGETTTSFTSPSITDTTNYYAVYASTYGCGSVSSNIITVNVLPEYETPILSPSIIGDICYGSDLTVTASDFVQHPWLEYQWLLYDELGDTTHIGDGDTTIEFENLIDSFSIALEISSTFDCGTVTSDILELNVLNELTVPVIDDEINGLPLCFGFSPGTLMLLLKQQVAVMNFLMSGLICQTLQTLGLSCHLQSGNLQRIRLITALLQMHNVVPWIQIH